MYAQLLQNLGLEDFWKYLERALTLIRPVYLIKNKNADIAGLQTATKTVTFVTKNINLQVKFSLTTRAERF